MNQSYVHGELSDLFFNHINDNYNDLFPHVQSENKSELLPSDVQEAVYKDAKSFIELYPQTIQFFGSPTIDALAQDFLRRL